MLPVLQARAEGAASDSDEDQGDIESDDERNAALLATGGSVGRVAVTGGSAMRPAAAVQMAALSTGPAAACSGSGASAQQMPTQMPSAAVVPALKAPIMALAPAPVAIPAPAPTPAPAPAPAPAATTVQQPAALVHQPFSLAHGAAVAGAPMAGAGVAGMAAAGDE